MCLAVFHYMHVYVCQWTWLVPIEVGRGNQKPCHRSSCRWLYAAMLYLGIESKYIPWVVNAVSHLSSPIISILTCIIYYICVLKLFMLTIFNGHDIIIQCFFRIVVECICKKKFKLRSLLDVIFLLLTIDHRERTENRED